MASFAGLGNLSDPQMWELASSVVRDILAGPSGGIPTQSTRNMALQLYSALGDIMTPEWQPDFLQGYFTPPAGMSVTPRTLAQLRELAGQEFARTGDWDKAMGWLPRETATPAGGTRTASQALQDLAWRTWTEATKEGRAWNPVTRQWEMAAPYKESLFGSLVDQLKNIPGYITSVLGGGKSSATPAPGFPVPGQTGTPGTTTGTTTGTTPGTPSGVKYDFGSLSKSLEILIRAMSMMGGTEATRAQLTRILSTLK